MDLRNIIRKKPQKRVYLVSYPKSGNTWLRFIIGNYLSNEELTFGNYHKVIPDIHRNPQDIIRIKYPVVFIKSHFQVQPEYPKVIYIVRDGRDVAVSYFHHLIGKGQIDESMNFYHFLTEIFMKDGGYFGEWGNHVISWVIKNEYEGELLVIRYEDLLDNTFLEVSKLLTFSGIQVNKRRLEKAISQCGVDKMMQNEAAHRDYSLEHVDVVHENFKFVRKGKSGDWKNYFNDQMNKSFLKKYEQIFNQLGYNYE